MGQDKFIERNTLDMDISEFSKNFYIEPNTIKYIDSQHRFIGELFNACGSEFFPKIIKKEHEKYWTARSLFSGKRNLSTDMRESFPQKINEEKFVTYFKERITKKSLDKMAQKFSINTTEMKIDYFLIALCRQLQIIIHDELDIDIVNKEYESLLQNYNSLEYTPHSYSLASPDSMNQFRNMNDKNSTKSSVRLWLPDAEFATEEQSGFKSFTPTLSSNDFMNPNSNIWGIRSAKGVGKTYLLQKMRRDLNTYAIPHYHKISKDNEWGTESVRFDDPILLEKADIKQLSGLWKVSILCLVINCIDDYEKRNKIQKMISKAKLSNNITCVLENAEFHNRLNEIINRILTDNTWYNTILKSYTELRFLCKQVINNRVKNAENPIIIFIDKVDQAILQPGAEIPECNNCYKDTKYKDCKETKEDLNYCLEQCRNCCYGCEKYASQYAGRGLRIYGSKYGKRYEHISQWQHLQLALVLAVDSIRLDFESKIQVYYAIRQEAFNAEENLLGANAPKIKEHTKVLHYSKDEQEEIFNNTIKIQHSDYLYDPSTPFL